MNVYQVNALTDVPISLQVAEVTTHLERQPPPSSIVIMIHGYKFDHRDPAHCPHATMYHPHSVATDFRTRSWPSELRKAGGDGVAIGFSWPSRGTIRQAYTTAAHAAIDLAELVKRLKQAFPDTAVQLMAHSLGVRVALEAFHQLEAYDIDRAAFLFPSEYQKPAEQAVRSALGKTVQILSIASKENYIFEQLFSCRRLAGSAAGPAFGQYQPKRPNIATLWIDQAHVIARLNDLGIGIERREKRICHWSAYTREGIFELYSKWLLTPQTLPLYALRDITHMDRNPAKDLVWGMGSPA